MKNLKRYIPTLVYDKLQELDFKNIEQLYVVCDMVFRSSIFKKEDTDYSNKYIDIPSYYFRDIITEYKTPIDFLKDNNIIECDEAYSKEAGKSLGYRFNENYISLLKEVTIQKTTIKKKIIKNRNKRNDEAKKALTTYKDFYLKEFDIDYNKALVYLNEWYDMSIERLNNTIKNNKTKEFMKQYIKVVNKYNSIFISLNAIKDGELFFKKNKTNGRIDTNLTSLKSEYKQFIKTDKELYSIDIVNSQPYMLSLLLDDVKDKEEVQKYKDWTSMGQFYENFGRAVYTRTGKEITRKEIKNLMFCIFYSKNTSYCKQKNIFKDIFPSILEHIESKKKRQHNKFAIEMQKVESQICLDIIARELDSKSISYYTIHDSFIVDKKDLNETKLSILNNFDDKYDSQPSLSIEKVSM
tara:strand:- start:25660 stop:26889 length:1230 start_codon:yes stop_codon:yes gene_type:complete